MPSQTPAPETFLPLHPDRITLTIALPRDASVNAIDAAMQAFQSEFGIPLVRDGLHFSVPTAPRRVGAA
ncbi:hypothetical protein [Acidithiobacillus sp.]|uniref:hypothetical protein n=1 Tax=Acidithiobacillus sp. TaxID=1872118 RepID=UPI0025BC8F38|nr:hypothetical protein [Acidithiobacillus sp.]